MLYFLLRFFLFFFDFLDFCGSDPPSALELAFAEDLTKSAYLQRTTIRGGGVGKEGEEGAGRRDMGEVGGNVEGNVGGKAGNPERLWGGEATPDTSHERTVVQQLRLKCLHPKTGKFNHQNRENQDVELGGGERSCESIAQEMCHSAQGKRRSRWHEPHAWRPLPVSLGCHWW